MEIGRYGIISVKYPSMSTKYRSSDFTFMCGRILTNCAFFLGKCRERHKTVEKMVDDVDKKFLKKGLPGYRKYLYQSNPRI